MKIIERHVAVLVPGFRCHLRPRIMHWVTSMVRCCAVLTALVMLAACETLPPQKPAPAPTPAPVTPQPPAEVLPAKPLESVSHLRASNWDAVPGWRDDNPQLAWNAFLTGCGTLKHQPAWRSICTVALALEQPARDTLLRFFEVNFTPYQVVNPDGSDNGLTTGYYEPLLHGSRTRSARYRYPVYGVPDDIVVIDLGKLYPELKYMRLRGRLEGRRVVPYFDRAQIEAGAAPLAGREILWVEDPVELFFLHIQGSGRVRLESGETIMLGYAEQNGHPYRSIGRLLIDRGELTLEQASMQGIKAWARRNPARLQDLLNNNPSYVFLHELPAGLSSPPGTLGVPLTAGRSIAVDPRYIPLGAPVFLATTMPNSNQPLRRLMLAQDTGGAIRGAVRADFFWGFGNEAGILAGAMRQRAKMWVLLPNDYLPPDGNPPRNP